MSKIQEDEIEKLAQSLRVQLSQRSLVVTSKSSSYQESIARWSSAAEKRAGIVVILDDHREVAIVIDFATSRGIEIAIRGGGHATSGSSSTEGGICIDLSRLRKVIVDPNTKTVTAQGGSLWVDVDKAAEEHGLAVVGGTVNTTGVGGLTLGGGYGYLVGQYGLVIDNLLEVELVLADGKTVTASRHKNSQLFWAIRGAGASFGVILSFTFQAHAMKTPVWGGALAIDISELQKVVAFANHLFIEPDPKSAMIWGFKAISPDTFGIVAVVFYEGTEEMGQALFAPLLNLQLLANTTCSRPYSSMNTLFNDDLASGHRRSMKGSAFLAPLDYAFARNCLAEFQDFIKRTPDASMSSMVFEVLPFKKIVSVSQTDTAFANRGAYGNILWMMGYTKPEHDQEIREWTRDQSKKAHEQFEKRKKAKALQKDGVTEFGVAEYFNYDGIGVGGKQVFGNNFTRLLEIKKRYDPTNIFSKGPQLLSQTSSE